jgi:hypothetical protein
VWITSWSRVLPEKLIWYQPVKKFPALYMEPGGSLPHSQEPIIYPYHTPDQFSPCSYSISWRSLSILAFYLCLGFQAFSFPHVSSPKPCMYVFLLSPIRTTCPAYHVILLDLITRIMFGEEYRSRISSLCSLPQSTHPSPFSKHINALQHPILENPQHNLLPQFGSPIFPPVQNRQLSFCVS